jgi:site-specific DNA-methyltransferase (adenine-specific)
MVMKPLSEKTYVDQALANGKGITWLDSCKTNQRFPANLLVSDDVLNSHSRYFSLEKWFDTTFPFIITPKAAGKERIGNKHPTLKPIKLMSYLVSLISREGDTILDPFVGSGTTLIAAKMLNRKYIGIELNPEYIQIANRRLSSIL